MDQSELTDLVPLAIQDKEPVDVKDNYTITEFRTIKHEYSEDELIELKEELYVISKHRFNREAILAKVKLVLNDYNEELVISTLSELDLEDIGDVGLKQLKKSHNALVEQINNGYEMISITVFGFDYQTEGKMVFFKNDGEFYDERELTDDERQLNIYKMDRSK